METSYREKLARLVRVLIILAMAGAVCWYLRSVLTYIALALVITLISLPFSRLFAKIRIGRFRSPSWLNSILSISSVFTVFVCLLTLLAPLVNDVVRDVSMANVSDLARAVSVPLSSFNEWARGVFPTLGPDFRIESIAISELQKVFDAGMLTNFVGGVTSFVANLAVTLFAVVFISFFLIRNPSMFEKILIAMVPDKMEDKIHRSVHEIGKLVSRYFIGVTVEVAGVWLINFIGLWALAQMGFKYSLSIAFLAGILNVIPYVGPLIGGVLGVSLSLVIHYAGAGVYGLSIGFLPFLLVLAAIFIFTQLIDNYVFQPFIYSSSVKAHPLEIFIVFLIAGETGGMLGMLVAVPAYTVLRVIAREFFGHVKAIRMLTSGQASVPQENSEDRQ